MAGTSATANVFAVSSLALVFLYALRLPVGVTWHLNRQE